MGGGGQSQETSGVGYNSPVLFNWEQIMPEWQKRVQKTTLPYLYEAATSGGMTPMEKKQQWASMQGEVDNAAAAARKNLAGRWVGGGASLNSPAYNAAKSAIDIDRMGQIRKSAADFAKLKLGAKDTAVKNLISGAFSSPVSQVGQSGWNTTSGSASAGGK
jgi:hypothetical protein